MHHARRTAGEAGTDGCDDANATLTPSHDIDEEVALSPYRSSLNVARKFNLLTLVL